MMKGDLHIHTSYSDGSWSVRELMVRAKEAGMTHLAITDHDTVDGVNEAVSIGLSMGITVIPGVEISAVDKRNGKKVHLLGYDFHPQAENIKRVCAPIIRQRIEQGNENLAALNQSGRVLAADDIAARTECSGIIYKQHLMAQMVKQGYAERMNDPLYEELFKGNGICNIEIDYVDIFTAVRAVKADGGIAVLAHPGMQDTLYLVDELVEAGLDGIELEHETNDEEVRERIRECAAEYGLLLTGGSDTHGDYGWTQEFGNIICPATTLQRLEKRRHDTMLEYACQVAREAGRRLRDRAVVEQEVCIKNAEISNLVTRYDRETEEFLVAALSERYPEHGFITEEKTEGSSKCGEYTWIIDPIDGTTNFVQFGREFAISIALYKNDKPLLGMVYDVVGRQMYTAIVGRGAWVNGRPLLKKRTCRTLSEAVVDFSLCTIDIFRRHMNIDLTAMSDYVRGHRSCGVASLAICRVAQGDLSMYMSARVYPWDYAAASIILHEMQGAYCMLDRPSSLKKVTAPDQVTFLAAENSRLIEDLKLLMDKKLLGLDQVN